MRKYMQNAACCKQQKKAHGKWFQAQYASGIPVSSGARKHFVDAEHVEGVHADAQVEGVFACVFHQILVARDAGCFQGLAGHVLFLPAHEMDAEWEVIDRLLLCSHVVDSDLGVCSHQQNERGMHAGKTEGVCWAPQKNE